MKYCIFTDFEKEWLSKPAKKAAIQLVQTWLASYLKWLSITLQMVSEWSSWPAITLHVMYKRMTTFLTLLAYHKKVKKLQIFEILCNTVQSRFSDIFFSDNPDLVTILLKTIFQYIKTSHLVTIQCFLPPRFSDTKFGLSLSNMPLLIIF